MRYTYIKECCDSSLPESSRFYVQACILTCGDRFEIKLLIEWNKLRLCLNIMAHFAQQCGQEITYIIVSLGYEKLLLARQSVIDVKW